MLQRLRRALTGGPEANRPRIEAPSAGWPGVRALRAGGIFDPSPNTVNVVGESFRQDALQAIGGRGPDGVLRPDQVAALLAEPTNPQDTQAVQVQINGDHVGYLDRADARAYLPVIDRLASEGWLFGCHASLTGGWDRGVSDRGSVGVVLHVGAPSELWQDLDERFGPVPRPASIPQPTPARPPAILPVIVAVPADLTGKSVCFTGPSAFVFRGGEVSRPMQELLAVQHGLVVLPRVSKALDILVVSGRDISTGKTTKAAVYGTTVVEEGAFWTALGVTFDSA